MKTVKALNKTRAYVLKDQHQTSEWQMFPYLIFISGMTCLAAGGVFVRLSEVGPITTAFYRIALSVPVAVILVQLTPDKLAESDKFRIPPWKDLFFMGLAGAALAADLILWHISFLYTTIANANLLANMVPFIIIPFTFWSVRERPSPSFLMACLIVFFGLILLIIGKTSLSLGNALGDGLALATAVFYAIYLILVSKYRQLYSAMDIILWSSYGSLALLLPASLLFEDTFIPESPSGIYILFGVACVSHVGGQGLIAVSLGRIPLRVSALLVLMQPIIAGVISFLIFAEALTPLEIVAFMFILSGMYVAKTKSSN
ncbi:DMT family transporter [Marinobacter nauticus]|uniref:DMT family transporter n=1 Tax=Marinobacter nauticus TaxID=2743 RepID=UPI004044E2DA